MSDYLMVAAIDFGTTYSGYAFSTISNFKLDPLKIHPSQPLCWRKITSVFENADMSSSWWAEANSIFWVWRRESLCRTGTGWQTPWSLLF